MQINASHLLDYCKCSLPPVSDVLCLAGNIAFFFKSACLEESSRKCPRGVRVRETRCVGALFAHNK